MRTNILVAGLLCAALILLSCGTKSVDDFTNKYEGTRLVMKAVIPYDDENFQRYEAEDAMIFGSAGIQEAAGEEGTLYSNKKMVKGLTNYLNNSSKLPFSWTGRSYIQFAVTVPLDGDYTVDIIMNGLNGAEKKPIIVQVNGIDNRRHELDATNAGPWNDMIAERFKLGLLRGLNTIRITHVPPAGSDQWINIDCIDVSRGPTN